MYDAASNKMIFCHKYARIKGNSIVLVANIFFFKWIFKIKFTAQLLRNIWLINLLSSPSIGRCGNKFILNLTYRLYIILQHITVSHYILSLYNIHTWHIASFIAPSVILLLISFTCATQLLKRSGNIVILPTDMQIKLCWLWLSNRERKVRETCNILQNDIGD